MNAVEVARLNSVERAKAIRETQKELDVCKSTIRIAAIKKQSLAPVEKRVDYLVEEIAQIKRLAAIKVARLEKQIEDIKKEQEHLPNIIQHNKKRIKELENDLNLLDNGKELRELAKLMERM